MKKKTLLIISLFIVLPLLSVWGCGGGGNSSTLGLEESDQFEGNDRLAGSGYSGYIFAPPSSSQSLFKSYNLTNTTSEEGLLILDNPDQAPYGYSPVIDCLVILPDGTTARSNEYGKFQFAHIPFSNSEKGIPFIIDPTESNFSRFAAVIMPLIVPKQETVPNEGTLHLIINPASFLISVGSKFQYRAYVMDNQGSSYKLPQGEVTWSFTPDEEGKNIGSISSTSGFFRALAMGKGKVSATARVNSIYLSASSDIEIIDKQQVASVYGQVTDALMNPLGRVNIFVGGFENGTVTDPWGNYSIPRVPTGKSLTLTFIYRGIVVKMLEDVIVHPGEVTEVNVSLDMFHEIGKIYYSLDADQIEGRIIFSAEGLPGPFSIEEFPEAKEFELLGVNAANPTLFQQLKENPGLSFPVMIEGTLTSSSEANINALPKVEVTSVQPLPIEDMPIQTLRGEISREDQQYYFQPKAKNSNAQSDQFILTGLETFPQILAKLENSSRTSSPCKIIGRIDRGNRIITLLDIHFLEVFVKGQGEIYYDPDFPENGAILLDSSSAPAPYILLNVEAISQEIYDFLIYYPYQRFSGTITGIEADDPLLMEYGYPIKVSRIRIFSIENNYLIHKRGKIWINEEGQVRFSPIFLSDEGRLIYPLQGMEQFNDIMATLAEHTNTIFYCFLSGEITDQAQKKIEVSQLELLEPAQETAQNDSRPKADGILYFINDPSQPNNGGRYLYQKLLADGSIEDKLYELSNLSRTDTELANFLSAKPDLIVQITLNYSETFAQGQPSQRGPTRLTVNEISVLQNVNSIIKVTGNLIYHSWENVVGLIATSPSLPEGTQQSFILNEVPDKILTLLLNNPDRFIPAIGTIQIFKDEQRSINNPITAKVHDLQTLVKQIY